MNDEPSLTAHADEVRKVVEQIEQQTAEQRAQHPEAGIAWKVEKAFHIALAEARDHGVPDHQIEIAVANILANIASSYIGSLFEPRQHVAAATQLLLPLPVAVRARLASVGQVVDGAITAIYEAPEPGNA